MSVAAPASPYKGLAPFGDSDLDALLFFGRERDREIVVANLIAARLTVLYGPSGVGKSSLLRAGVARALRELPEEPLVVVFSAWGGEPARALADALAAAAGIEPGGPLVDAARRAVEARGDVYLILDQAEEYFLYHSGGDRFADELAAVATEPLRVNVLLSVREDALAKLDRFKARIPHILGNYLRLDRLDRAAGEAAIVSPLGRFAELGGASVAAEPALVAAVLDQVEAGRIEDGLGGVGGTEANGRAAGIEAPYLQLVMERLWDVERGAGSAALRASTLGELGGAHRIVADHLERAIDVLSAEQQALAARLFRQLVTPSGTKIAYDADDLADYAGAPADSVRPVADALAASRILRRDDRGRYEIYHDVLAGAVLAWRARFEEEQAVDRARAEARRRVRRLGFLFAGALVALALMGAVAAYAFDQRDEAQRQAERAELGEQQVVRLREETKQQKAVLADLEEQTEAQQAQVDALSDEADKQRAAVAASQHQVDTLSDEADKQQAAVAAGAAVTAKLRRQAAARTAELAQLGRSIEAKEAALEQLRRDAAVLSTSARSRQLVAASTEQLGSDPELSLLLAREAALKEDSPLVAAALRRALLLSHVRRALPAPQALAAAAYSSDGRRIVTAGEDGRARVYAAGGGAPIAVLDHGGPVVAAALSPDGSVALTAGKDGIARIWSVARVAQLHEFDHGPRIVAAALGPDGRRVAVAGGRTVTIWDAESGRRLHTLVHGVPPRGLELGRDGTSLLTWGGSEWRLYDAASGSPLRRVTQAASVLDATRSKGGDLVATGGADGVARIWDARSGDLRQALRPHDSRVLAVAFGPDGSQLATASADITGRVWRRDAQGEWVQQAPLMGHENYVTDIAFSRDGDWVLTSSRDGTARVWQAETGTETALLAESGRALDRAAFTPDGRGVLSFGSDGVARIWDAGTAPTLRPTAAVADAQIAGSPKRTARSATGATATIEGKVVRLKAAGRTRVLSGHTDVVNSVDFSPDGSTLVTAGRDHRMRIWNVATGKPHLPTIEAHQASVVDARFSPDGRWIVSAGPTAVRLWDASTGTWLATYRGARPLLAAVGFGPDSRTIAAASADGSVYRMTCDICGGTPELLKLAGERVRGTGRTLTAAERRRFLG